MKIIFFCGSAEPVKDGVSDYTAVYAENYKKKSGSPDFIFI